eukprot:3416868-Rhodomonas_salina.1
MSTAPCPRQIKSFFSTDCTRLRLIAFDLAASPKANTRYTVCCYAHAGTNCARTAGRQAGRQAGR